MNHLFIDPNIAKASTISTNIYTSEILFEAAKEKIFAPSWQFIGSKEMVKFNGDVQPFTLLENYMNEPLLLTKDTEGKFGACRMFVPTAAISLLINNAAKQPIYVVNTMAGYLNYRVNLFRCLNLRK